MRHSRVSTLLPIFGAMILVVLVSGCVSYSEVPLLEKRTQDLNQELMCPVCPGESIDQSQNKLAAQMRAIVAEKVESGWSDQQVKDFFVERYGPSVLLAPLRRGFSSIVWILPPVGTACALGILFLVLRSLRRPKFLVLDDDVSIVSLSDDEKVRYFELIGATLREDRSSGRDTQAGN